MIQGLDRLRKVDLKIKNLAEGGGSVWFSPIIATCRAERKSFKRKVAGAESRRENSPMEQGIELDGILEIADTPK